MSELRKNGDGSLTLGLLPKISIDCRIRCPCSFTAEFPPPEPPTQRHVDMACRAASKIVTAIWPFRQYVEVIKVGYILGLHSPEDMNITGEIIIVVPSIAEKVIARAEEQISGYDWARYEKLGIDLLAPDEEYENILVRLSKEVASRSYKAIREKKDFLSACIGEILEFQVAFGQDM